MYMFRNSLFLIFTSLITTTNSFIAIPNKNIDLLSCNRPLHDNYQKYRDITNTDTNKYWSKSGSRTGSRSRSIYLLNTDLPHPPDSPTLVDHLLDITIREKYLGKLIVEKISAFLPKVDTIGHNVLHANNEFIDYILNDTNLSEIMKKKIVLMSIQLAIMGDNMGSTFLQLYYDIVDKCL